MAMTFMAGMRQGILDNVSLALPVIAFGLGFGAAAAASGLDWWLAASMSAVIFAGASQYGALDLWLAPLPLLSMIILVTAVNARHLVLGATLRRQLGGVPGPTLYGSLFFLSDANWAATQASRLSGMAACGHLLGGGLLLWLCWNAGTVGGLFGGNLLGDLHRLGLDAIMPAFFAASLTSMVAVPARDMPPWVVSGVAASGLCLLIPTHYAVLLATSCGGVAAWLRYRHDH